MPPVTWKAYPRNPIKTWNELVAAEASFGGTTEWAFRGQDVVDFPASSLERHCKDLVLTGSRIADLEVKLIRDFARRYHLYAGAAPPPKGYTLEWLSLLRHYGTPTRLVDFSYSFFMACFFALETAKGDATVWAVDATGLARGAKAYISRRLPRGGRLFNEYLAKRDGEPFRAVFMRSPPIPFVWLANPLRLNERLTIQQGLFLAPGDVTATFEKNMAAIPNHGEYVTKVIIAPAARQDALLKLHRMGINTASLYPGLEGFARSLKTKSLILRKLPRQGVRSLREV